MTLIEQLQKGKVAIEAHCKYDDVQRVLSVAFPKDDYRVNNYKYTHYYLDVDIKRYWTFKLSDDSLPEGMEAVHIDEFIKELDKEKESSTEMAKEYNNSGVSMVTLSQYEAEKELRIEAEEAGLIWKDSAEKLQAQLKELQPFERGAEGWGYIGHNWSKEKYIYIGRHEYKGHAVDSDRFGLKYVSDFTTENPHKKDTVFYKPEGWGYDGILKDAKHVVLSKYRGARYQGFEFFVFLEDRYTIMPVTQIGDDLQAKFNDKENLKYIDLGK